MTLIIAFVAGIGVSLASIAMPHSRSKNSIEEFDSFKSALSTLHLEPSKTRHK